MGLRRDGCTARRQALNCSPGDRSTFGAQQLICQALLDHNSARISVKLIGLPGNGGHVAGRCVERFVRRTFHIGAIYRGRCAAFRAALAGHLGATEFLWSVHLPSEGKLAVWTPAANLTSSSQRRPAGAPYQPDSNSPRRSARLKGALLSTTKLRVEQESLASDPVEDGCKGFEGIGIAGDVHTPSA